MKLHFFSDYSIIIRSMKKVKHILVTFLHSFTPQDIYYPKLLHTRLQFSLKYYIFIIFSFACVFTGIVVYQFSPGKIISYKNSINTTLSSFPEDARITIAHGILESNQNKPLFLWVYDNNQPLFVFMVHTKDVLNNSHIPLPLVFLGNNQIQLTYKDSSLIRPYDNSLDILISRETMQALIPYINSIFPSFLFGFYISLLILFPLLFIGVSSLFIFLSASLTCILLRTFIPHIHLKKCLQAGMHGTHIPLIVSIFLFSLFPSASNILIIMASLIFVFTLVATYEMYSKEIPHSKGR